MQDVDLGEKGSDAAVTLGFSAELEHAWKKDFRTMLAETAKRQERSS